MAKQNAINNRAYALTSDTTITATAGDITATSGNLVITAATTSAVGQITQATKRVFHTYGAATSNIFVGSEAGNFTHSALDTVGVGYKTLNALSIGTANTAIGSNTLLANNSGGYNVGVGLQVLSANTTGSYNAGLGVYALGSLLTGQYNLAIGAYQPGASYTGAESSNILIGSVGTLAESNKIHIGTQGSGDGQQNATYIVGIYNTAVGATAGVVLSDSAHKLGGLAGTAGQVLQGGTKPVFSTTTYPATTAIGDVLIATAANTITAVTGAATATWVLTANGAGTSPTFQANTGGGIGTLNGDSGSATGATVTIAGTASQITTAGAGATLTISIPSSPSLAGTVTAATGLTVTSGNVTATSGNLVITAATTSAVGQITQAAKRIFHTYGTENCFIGLEAGNFTTSGTGLNTGVGYKTLFSLTTGYSNMAFGRAALYTCADGYNNVAIGRGALDVLTSGNSNIGLGYGAASGVTSGSNNVAIGTLSLASGTATTAHDNIVIGSNAGNTLASSEHSNIYISNVGVAAESNKIRIGTQGSGTGQQDKAYIAGIYNTAVGATAGVVLSDSAHQLGGLAGAAGTVLVGGTKPAFSTTVAATIFDTNVTAAGVTLSGTTLSADGTDANIDITITPKGTASIVSTAVYAYAVGVTNRAMLVDSSGYIGNITSSRRFKENIKDMGDDSSSIMSLRPVSFTYKSDPDGRKKLGLIAEEVAEIMPQIVSFDEEHQPYTVSYHELPALLLNELQKMAKRIAILEAKLEAK